MNLSDKVNRIKKIDLNMVKVFINNCPQWKENAPTTDKKHSVVD